MAGTIRHQIQLDENLSRQLAALAADPGGSKSAVIADALRAWLSREAGIGIDPVVKARLDRISRAMHRLERDQSITLEALGLFIRYQLSILPPVPEADQPAASALGQRRFRSFIDQLGRRLAAGHTLGDELLHSAPAGGENAAPAAETAAAAERGAAP